MLIQCVVQGGVPQALAHMPNLEILMLQNAGLRCVPRNPRHVRLQVFNGSPG